MSTTEQSGPEPWDLVAYLKGELGEPERAAFEAQLARDPDLRREVERGRDVLGLLEAASERETVRLVDWILHEAVRREASDIHLVPEREDLGTWLRIGGDLRELSMQERFPGSGRIPRDLRQAVVDRWKVMGGCDLGERQAPQEGHAALDAEGKPYDLRVAVIPTLRGERVTVGIFKRGGFVLG